jgi:SAM-dependent methyltransferase
MLASFLWAIKRRVTLYPGTMIRRRAAMPKLLEFTPQAGRVLDAGCGSGTTLALLARKKPQAKFYGVDLGGEEIDRARQICAPFRNVTLIRGDIAKTQLPNDLDLICCMELLEHLPDPFLAIKRLSWALKKGGYLLIHTPHIPKHYSLKPNHPRWQDPGHFRDGFTAEELKDGLADAGLQVSELKYTFGIFGALAWELPLVLFQGLPLKLVNLLLYPITAALTLLDNIHFNRTGNGIMIVGRR